MNIPAMQCGLNEFLEIYMEVLTHYTLLSKLLAGVIGSGVDPLTE